MSLLLRLTTSAPPPVMPVESSQRSPRPSETQGSMSGPYAQGPQPTSRTF